MPEFITNIKNDYTKTKKAENETGFIPLYKIRNYNIIISNDTRNPLNQHKSKLINDKE